MLHEDGSFFLIAVYAVGLVFFMVLCPMLAVAESLQIPSSSGGIIDREIESQYEEEEVLPEKDIPSVEIDIPEQELEFSDEKKVHIATIVVAGNTFLSNRQLQQVTDRYTGKDLSIRDIHKMCREIQKLYFRQGYFLVRVYPPAQEIYNNKLFIEVMEGTLGQIEIEGNRYYKSKFIRAYFKKYLGKTINYRDFLKTMLLINENSDLQVEAIFQKGKDLGTVDLMLRVADKDPLHINVDVNNYGSSVTTKMRSGVRADIGNVLQDGDQLSMIGVVGYPIRRLRFIDAIYHTPLNVRGTSLDLSFLFSDFQVDRLKPLHLHGKTQVAAMKFSHALQRTKRWDSDVYSGLEYKQIQNFANHQTAAYDKLRNLSLGYKLDYMDSFRGRNVADIGVFCGLPNFLGGLKPVDPKCSRSGAGGRYVYVRANYQRIQQFSPLYLLVGSIQGQLSFYKLPLSEEFYIGGINTVRGYPLATALGDSGICANLEFKFPPFFLKSARLPFSGKLWNEVLQFVTFIDHGEVFVYGSGITDQVNRLYLTSAGLGTRIFGPYGIDCSMDVGVPLIDRKQKTQNAIFYFRINMRLL